MAERSQQAQRVFEALESRIAEMGIELIDVAFVKEGSSRFLRIFIDKEGGVGLDDCTDVSHLADPIIDDELKIKDHDYLEVSSPGLERPLKTARDFERYQGEWIEVKLYKALEERKIFEGILMPSSAETVVIKTDNGEVLSFKTADAARIKRMIRFE
ncbi:MAG: ribosome maturation factor RimP [Clostridiaceae bacterium]|nr:ribosome maturation factor RimP [Clostridiaceae bacterium]